jgi:hypothetical protein
VRLFAEGDATKQLSDDISATLDGALKKENLTQNLAAGINTAISPVSGLVRASVTAMLTGSLTEAFKDAFKAGTAAVLPFEGLGFGAIDSLAAGARAAGDKVVTTVKGIADDAQQGLRDVWQQNSPSKLFYSLGLGAMNSLAHELQDGGGGAVDEFRRSIEAIKAEFERITGRKLKGIVGQSNTHTRLGFDHSQGADMAVAPGTADARLVERLAAQYGVPVLRQYGARRNARGRVTSTGAHLHLGRLSPNLDRSDAYLVSEASATPEMQRGGATPVAVTNLAELRGLLARDQSEFGDGITQYKKVPKYENGQLVGYDAFDPNEFRETGVEGFGEQNDLPVFKRDLLAVLATIPHINTEILRTNTSITATTEGFNANEAAAGSFYKTVVGGGKTATESLSNIRGAFESSFTDMFQHIDEGFKGMLLSFVSSFLQALEQMAAAALATQIGKLIFGGEGDSGGGGFIGGFLKILGMGVGAAAGAIGGGFSGAGAGGGWATGGYISGAGTGTSDSIHAMLSNGEYVISAAAVDNVGRSYLDQVNSGNVPQTGSGGNGQSNQPPQIHFAPVFNITGITNLPKARASAHQEMTKLLRAMQHIDQFG